MIDTHQFRNLAQRKDWQSLYAMLDDARNKPGTDDDVRSEVHWRLAALELQQRHQEALDLLQIKAHVYTSKCYVKHKAARLLVRLGREQDALAELRDAPLAEEMKSFSALVMDAKFFYYYLLAKTGESSVESRIAEIPTDFIYITSDGSFLTRQNISAELACLR